MINATLIFFSFSIKLVFAYYFVLNINLKGLPCERDVGFEAVRQMRTTMA